MNDIRRGIVLTDIGKGAGVSGIWKGAVIVSGIWKGAKGLLRVLHIDVVDSGDYRGCINVHRCKVVFRRMQDNHSSHSDKGEYS